VGDDNDADDYGQFLTELNFTLLFTQQQHIIIQNNYYNWCF